MNTKEKILNQLIREKNSISNDIFALLSLKDLNREFIYKTKLLKELLTNIKKELDSFDEVKHKLKEKKERVDFATKKYIHQLDSSFFFIWNIVHLLPTEQVDIYQAYFQQQLHHLFDGSPFNKKLFEKPLGYPADYQMVLYISDNHYLGKSTYDKFIHQYSMQIPLNVARRNRINYFKNLIQATYEKNKNAKITCLDGGPSIEIIEFLKENVALTNANLTCLNSEQSAIDYLKKQLKTNKRLKKLKEGSINILNYNLSDVLHNSNLSHILSKQDLIYSGCIIDYFDNQLAKKIINILIERLNKNGVLIIASINKDSKHKAYTELLGGMYIQYRDINSLKKLTEDLSSVTNISIIPSETDDLNLFLKIVK